MPRYTEEEAEVLVFSFKEGLLSKLAHDLKIRVEHFTLDVNDDAVQATFDPRSLRVMCARIDGQDAPKVLSESDKGKIYKNIVDDVLDTNRYREIRFESTEVTQESDRARIVGHLHLHGRSRQIACDAAKRADRWIAEITIHQPDFGIKPYKAAFGALKVQADVRIQVSVPAREG